MDPRPRARPGRRSPPRPGPAAPGDGPDHERHEEPGAPAPPLVALVRRMRAAGLDPTPEELADAQAAHGAPR
ncbi:hypothetical protein [Streptomyces clavuligerus]|uniref:hypothetical protein n=1 Tax=Streptomyces clavuligerus TaxID=1901 RepID=UPI0002F03F53|nr:hypothetical protein [Streptomyces clavuligerus]